MFIFLEILDIVTERRKVGKLMFRDLSSHRDEWNLSAKL